MHRFCPFLLLLFIINSYCLGQPESVSSNVGQNVAIVDPMEEPWHNSDSRLSSGWLLKLRRKRDGESANEQIQKCIQENTATGATPPPADPNDNPESGYGKCDLAVDCCNLVNEDKKENEKVECDCAKLMPKMK